MSRTREIRNRDYGDWSPNVIKTLIKLIRLCCNKHYRRRCSRAENAVFHKKSHRNYVKRVPKSMVSELFEQLRRKLVNNYSTQVGLRFNWNGLTDRHPCGYRCTMLNFLAKSVSITYRCPVYNLLHWLACTCSSPTFHSEDVLLPLRVWSPASYTINKEQTS